jgi:hypothetical protein
MLKVIDLNQTIIVPEGYEFTGLRADGAYLVLDYRQYVLEEKDILPQFVNYITIYVNNGGREVLRVENLGVALPKGKP